jgi:hypothetical protein
LPGSGAEAGEPAAGLLHGGLFLRLLAQALLLRILLLVLAFVGGLLLGCGGGLVVAVVVSGPVVGGRVWCSLAEPRVWAGSCGVGGSCSLGSPSEAEFSYSYRQVACSTE